jgi:hypothetical protein
VTNSRNFSARHLTRTCKYGTTNGFLKNIFFGEKRETLDKGLEIKIRFLKTKQKH